MTGRLLILLAAIALVSGCNNDFPPKGCVIFSWGQWLADVDGPVLALTVVGDRLYAGGEFVVAGVDTANHVACSRGGCWSNLGNGMTGDGPNVAVRAIAEYAGDVIAGGSFSVAGAESASNVARWDGDSWHPLGGGTDGPVNALAAFDGNLVAAGDFDHAGGAEAHNIAQWDGAVWAPLGSGTGGLASVRCLCVFQGNLIAGGDFTSAGGVPADHVAGWDGTGWAPLGAGTDGPVHAMTVVGERLIVGGEFTLAGGLSANCIAPWDGARWYTLGSGLGFEAGGDCVRAFGAYRAGLVAGGTFVNAGHVPVNHVAFWYGGWSPVGSYEGGVDGDVFAVTTFQGDLVVGGSFATADGYASTENVASYRELGCIK